MILVDSNILIEISRTRNAHHLDRWKALADSGEVLACSVVSISELWTGARKYEYRLLNLLLDSLVPLPVSVAVAYRAGIYMSEFGKSHKIDPFDYLIAATARVSRIPLWTDNRKHYPMRDIQLI